jgi:hypothetical protein
MIIKTRLARQNDDRDDANEHHNNASKIIISTEMTKTIVLVVTNVINL